MSEGERRTLYDDRLREAVNDADDVRTVVLADVVFFLDTLNSLNLLNLNPIPPLFT